MSPSWIWSDKIINERVARVGYNHLISDKGEWNNCFSKFSNRVLPPSFISTILQSVRKENLAHYFPYDVKLRLLAHSRSFLANQKARNAIVGAENLLIRNIYLKGKKYLCKGYFCLLFPPITFFSVFRLMRNDLWTSLISCSITKNITDRRKNCTRWRNSKTRQSPLMICVWEKTQTRKTRLS